LSNIQRGLAAGKRVFELIDTQPTITNKKDAIPIQRFEKAICFNNVSFSYGKRTVIQDFSLTIEKGKTVALVGPSGSGKSTLVDLLIRLYEVSSGDISIDGISIRDYDFYALRRLIGMVTQETILLHDTVYNNIAFGRPEATAELVIQAAQTAQAHDFILQLPEGYQTLVGERGNKLSGGQAQRLSIARAILTHPPILILDEATSALDSASEELVQSALNQLMKNRTALVVAHRLSTIKEADEIIVLEEGKIIERGTHDALMQKKGLYKTLSRLQGSFS
jgi:subfamily B ATP-binding cassette protein MsbA